MSYKAWGETRFSSGTTYTNRHFTGQLDETSSIGLYFFNARFYHPVLGRFSSADSLIPEPGNPEAWDRSAGMYNNLVRFIDPTGHGVDCGIWESNCKSRLKQIKEHNKKTLTLSQNKLNKEKKRTEITISPNTTNGQKYGLIFTEITMVVGFTAAELSLGVAGVAAASTGPAGIVFDALIVIPTELILIDVEIATVRYIYDVVKTGTKEGKETYRFHSQVLYHSLRRVHSRGRCRSWHLVRSRGPGDMTEKVEGCP